MFFYVGAQVCTWSYYIQYVQDYTHQPEKFAAIQGLYTTQEGAPLAVFAYPVLPPPQLKAKIEIPDTIPVKNPRAVKKYLFVFINLLFRIILIKSLILHKDK